MKLFNWNLSSEIIEMKFLREILEIQRFTWNFLNDILQVKLFKWNLLNENS